MLYITYTSKIDHHFGSPGPVDVSKNAIGDSVVKTIHSIQKV